MLYIVVVADENDRAQRHFDAIVEPFQLVGNTLQSPPLPEDDEEEGSDWDSDSDHS